MAGFQDSRVDSYRSERKSEGGNKLHAGERTAILPLFTRFTGIATEQSGQERSRPAPVIFREHDSRTMQSSDGLASNTILSIEEDSAGAMWFATPSGLSCFARNRWKTYGTQDGLPSENVSTLFEDRFRNPVAGNPARYCLHSVRPSVHAPGVAAFVAG